MSTKGLPILLGLLLFLCIPAGGAEELSVERCGWYNGGCFNDCYHATDCTPLCDECVSSPDPVFVNKDQRDLSGLQRERRARAFGTYQLFARRLADELALQ